MAIKITVSEGKYAGQSVACAASNLGSHIAKSLEQLRAIHALTAAPKIGVGKGGGRAVAKKVPAQIVQNGFLGALAFAIESVSDTKKFCVDGDGYYTNQKPLGKDTLEGCGYANTLVAIMKHLGSNRHDLNMRADGLENFMSELCGSSAERLRAVTDEALGYLNYLRRFVKPGKDEQTAESEG